MARYRRVPSIIVLLMALAIGLLYVRSRGKGGLAADAATLDSLAKQIAGGKSDINTWSRYARRLAEAGRFDDAALAWRKVLDAEAYNREARLGCAMALSQSKNSEEFLAFMRELSFSEPKLAVEIFERRECQGWLSDGRFSTVQKEAKAQALD